MQKSLFRVNHPELVETLKTKEKISHDSKYDPHFRNYQFC